MSLPRLNHATRIADRLNELAAIVKTRSRASLTDASHILETGAKRFFNALYGWSLANLNTEQANYPAADLGDRGRRIAIQITNEASADKIKHTAGKAIEHKLGTDFNRLIVLFLLPRKPTLPKKFTQPPGGPKIETWDIADLLRQLQELPDLDALARAAKVLDEEMGKISAPGTGRSFDISRILKYAPAELIGRDEELRVLHGAWTGNWPSAVNDQPSAPAPTAGPPASGIRDGLASTVWASDTFAYASSFDAEKERYVDLRAGRTGIVVTDDPSSFLVKPAVAWRQMEKEQARAGKQPGGTSGGWELGERGTATTPLRQTQTPPAAPKAPQPKRYFASVDLNPTKAGLEFTTLMQEVAQHFTRDPGTKVSIRVEIEAERPDGFNDTTVRTVSENARTLKFTQSEFGG